MHSSLIRVAGATGARTDRIDCRVLPEAYNAVAVGRSIVACSPVLLASRRVDIEAVLAHEVGHHVHGDAIHTTIRWWFLAPLMLVERMLAACERTPVRPAAHLLRTGLLYALVPVLSVIRASDRRRELLADAFSADAVYGPAVIRILTSLEDDVHSPLQELLSAHPPSSDRVAHLHTLDLASEVH